MQLINKLQDKAKQLKSEAQVLMIAYKDTRTPFNAKILIGITVGYLLCPIDLIPDFIPVLGLLDDLIIVPLLIVASIKLIPVNVLNDARAEVTRNPARFKKTNWLFAILVILVWIFLGYLLYRQLKYLWE
jgi:uncharacterized membrane protein YkvA (DUF1232 family)